MYSVTLQATVTDPKPKVSPQTAGDERYTQFKAWLQSVEKSTSGHGRHHLPFVT